MGSYIVRIYRGEGKDSNSVVGIVEKVGTGDKKAFTNADELWEILNLRKRKKQKPAKGEVT